jgi:glycosyltransferase involved in cell wall biosynthesis
MIADQVPRVVHVVVAGEMGGAERMVLDLARSGAAGGARHAIALVTCCRNVDEIFAGSGVRLHRRSVGREGAGAYLWRSLGPSDVAWLADVISKERASIAHLHTFGSHVVGTRAALRTGAAVVRTEHSSRVYTTASCWPFSRWSLVRSQAVVAVSEYIRRVVVAKAPFVAARMRVVFNGVDTSRFTPFAKLRCDHRPFSFVMVARLEPRKGIDLALEAVARLASVTLDIVGDGSERARLERRAAHLGVNRRVHFHGFLPDPLPVMQRADAALTSSLDEGLGLGLLECMSAGLPVAAVPIGGIPEIVLDGVTGWMSAGRSAGALADAMSRAMASRERARTVGAQARIYVERRHSLAAMTASYGRLYRELRTSRELAKARPPV